jgi:hypothetical protein
MDIHQPDFRPIGPTSTLPAVQYCTVYAEHKRRSWSLISIRLCNTRLKARGANPLVSISVSEPEKQRAALFSLR